MGEIFWNKQIRREIAHLPALGIEVERKAKDIQRTAEQIASTYSDTGNFARSFRTEKHSVDTLVVNDDPAAAMIETGHMATGRGGKVTKNTRWVEGKFTLANAAKRNAVG